MAVALLIELGRPGGHCSHAHDDRDQASSHSRLAGHSLLQQELDCSIIETTVSHEGDGGLRVGFGDELLAVGGAPAKSEHLPKPGPVLAVHHQRADVEIDLDSFGDVLLHFPFHLLEFKWLVGRRERSVADEGASELELLLVAVVAVAVPVHLDLRGLADFLGKLLHITHCIALSCYQVSDHESSVVLERVVGLS